MRTGRFRLIECILNALFDMTICFELAAKDYRWKKVIISYLAINGTDCHSLCAGGLWRDSWLDHNLVDFFVPFLPLEYRHVVQCAMAEMEAKGLAPDPDLANRVASELTYFPKTDRIFSVKGCKTIESKLDYYI